MINPKYLSYQIHKGILDLIMLLGSNRASKKPKNPKKKILIVKPDAIGDYILFRNFIKIIRESERYKGYEIHLLGNKLWKNLFDSLDSKYVDKSFFLSSKDFYKRKPIKKIVDELNNENYSEIIHAVFSRNSIIDIILGRITSLKKVAFKGDNTNTSSLIKLITDKYYDQLITCKKPFEFDRNKEFFEKILDKKINLKNPKINMKTKRENYLVINPGASSIYKQWPPENFAKLIDHLIEKYKTKVFIIGSKNEIPLAENIKSQTRKKNKVSLFHGNPLFDVLKLIANCRGVVTNETSTTHMAVALKKKVYCMTGNLGKGRMHPYPNSPNAIYFYPPKDRNISQKDWTKNLEQIRSISLRDVQYKSIF